jgi:lipopolysaccharide biosynthesis glycosyltransferase
MDKDVIKIFIGFDPVESTAWHTLVHSILRQSSRPVAFIPINIANIKNIFNRSRDIKQSNEFSFSRFLVPHLAGYEGHALFMDCDMLVRTDICEIFDVTRSEPDKAIYVVKHDYEPKNDVKFLNTIQYKYPRKNWSSVVLWNCGHPANRIVTPEFVNKSTAMDLHRFTWLENEQIGSLDVRWNWLVGEYDTPPQDVKNLHWTIGGPYFEEFRSTDYSEEWFSENKKMNFCKQIAKD